MLRSSVIGLLTPKSREIGRMMRLRAIIKMNFKLERKEAGKHLPVLIDQDCIAVRVKEE
jgi:hypothetical protein